MSKLRVERVAAWAIVVWVVCLALFLTSCGRQHTKTGAYEPRPRLVWNQIALVLHDRLDKTGFDFHYTDEGWLGWLKELDRILRAQGFTPKQITINIYPSNAHTDAAFLKLYGHANTGMWGWPTAQGGLLRGFRSGGQVHLTQGIKRTCRGFGAHLVAHEWLPRDDPTHANHPGQWGLWDQFFLREMDWLAATRPR